MNELRRVTTAAVYALMRSDIVERAKEASKHGKKTFQSEGEGLRELFTYERGELVEYSRIESRRGEA